MRDYEFENTNRPSLIARSSSLRCLRINPLKKPAHPSYWLHAFCSLLRANGFVISGSKTVYECQVGVWDRIRGCAGLFSGWSASIGKLDRTRQFMKVGFISNRNRRKPKPGHSEFRSRLKNATPTLEICLLVHPVICSANPHGLPISNRRHSSILGPFSPGEAADCRVA